MDFPTEIVLRYAPSEDQIAAELTISTLEYQQLLGDWHGLEIRTLHRQQDPDSVDEELVYVADRQENDPFFRRFKGEITKRLTEVIEALPEPERPVISLYSYEDLTRHEISLALEMSELRVQQIRVSAALHLRAALANHPPIGCKPLSPIGSRGTSQSRAHSMKAC